MDVLYANDRKGKYPNSWYAQTALAPKPFDRLENDITCDVCIIGAGYTGLSAALHLAGTGHDVVVVDAHRVGWGASGRNGGQLSNGARVEASELVARHGLQTAQAIWQLGRDANTLVRQLVADHNIDCDLSDGVLHTNHRRRFDEETRKEVDLLNEKFGHDTIRFVDKVETRELVNSPVYCSASHDTRAAHLHPLKFALGLTDIARAAGARIFEQTEVTHLDREKVQVRTATGNIAAEKIVIACNGYLRGLEPETARRVMPINNFIIATEPLGKARAQALIKDNLAVADSRFVVNYFRLSPDHRLLFGGGESYGYRFPRDIKALVAKHMVRVFPQLKNVTIDYGWGGTLAITLSRLPRFANTNNRLYVASGYSGEGVGMATMAGALIARAIDGDPKPFDAMAQLPARMFPGGRLFQRPLLAAAMLYYGLRDRF